MAKQNDNNKSHKYQSGGIPMTGDPAIDAAVVAAQAVGVLGTGVSNAIQKEYTKNINDQNVAEYLTSNNLLGDNGYSNAVNSINNNLQNFDDAKNVDNLSNIGVNQIDNVSNPNAWQELGMYTGDMLGAMSKGIPGILDAWGTMRRAFEISGDNSRADKINKEINRVNLQNATNYYNQVDKINQRQQRQAMMNYFAEGGLLNEFDTGGSHEENPLGGIPQGIASDGLPNLVEEGEVRSDFDDAKIFNNQEKNYTITEKDCEEYLLPKSVVGCNPAEAIKKLKKEYEDRVNDPISIATMKEWDNRVFAFQEDKTAKLEEKRMKKAIKNMPDEEKAALLSSLEQPMAQQEGVDLNQPMYAKGGKIYIKPSHRGKFTALKKRTGKSASWFKAHGTPAQKKMATFALNAKKWSHKHDIGDYLEPDNWEAAWYKSYSDPPEGTWYNPITDTYDAPLQFGLTTDYVYPLDKPYRDNLKNTVVSHDVPELPKYTQNPNGGMSIDQVGTSKGNINLANLRYAPAVGAGIGAIVAALQPKDYKLSNRLEQLASELKPVGAPHIGGYRRYTPYDVNLGDAENLALQAQALAANRGQNRATQGALNTAVIAKSQEANAKRNLAAQQANEANRLAVDTYNLGIDQFNAQRDSQYDQLNQQILNNRLNMLSQAAQAADASRTAWANNINTTTENFFNQLGNVGKDQWVRNQRDALLTALGAEGIKELMKSAEGRAWLAQNGYYNS